MTLWKPGYLEPVVVCVFRFIQAERQNLDTWIIDAFASMDADLSRVEPGYRTGYSQVVVNPHVPSIQVSRGHDAGACGRAAWAK